MTPQLDPLALWIHQSHNWGEEAAGRFRCVWCQATTIATLTPTLRDDAPLCPKNPAVLRTAQAAIDATIAELREADVEMSLGRMVIDPDTREVILRVSDGELEAIARRIQEAVEHHRRNL